MLRFVVVLLACATMFASAADAPKFVVVTRQDDNGVGMVETYDSESGKRVLDSNISFSFKWPYVQMNTNMKTNEVYTLTIPDDNIPRLYKLQSSADALKESGLWTIEDGTIIFDLQSSESKNTLFGIKVTGQYQRTLSNIQLLEGNAMKITELYDLPEFWYVNASTYNGRSDSYFALINNFPGREDSTLDQQILQVNFADCVVGSSTPKPNARLVEVGHSDRFGQLQFIAQAGDFLFASSINLDTNVAYLSTLNARSGKLTATGFTVGNATDGVTEIGPLVAHSPTSDSHAYTLTFFARRGGTSWSQYLLTFDADSNSAVVTASTKYEGSLYQSFAAGTIAFKESP
jgi:hypothetical protein